MSSRTTSEKEITAAALGGAVATLAVIVAEWLVGHPTPTGMEGALAVVFAAAVGWVRKMLRERSRAQETQE